MYYPELDALCHEVAGKLAELRRLTMESPVLTDDQETLQAELARLLRLVDASLSRQIHSLLGDSTTADAAFLVELRAEFARLTEPPPALAVGHAPREAATPVLPPETPWVNTEGEPIEIRPANAVYALRWPLTGRDPAHQFAFCDINGTWFLIDHDRAMRFASRSELDTYLIVHESTARATEPVLWRQDDEPGEPDGPVLAPLEPDDPVRTGGNARRLEDAAVEAGR